MLGLGIPELVLILVIVMVIFGVGKLPQIGSALGRSIKEFKSEAKDLSSDENSSPAEIPAETATVKGAEIKEAAEVQETAVAQPKE